MALKLDKFQIECIACGAESVIEFWQWHEGCYPEVGQLECKNCGTAETVDVDK